MAQLQFKEHICVLGKGGVMADEIEMAALNMPDSVVLYKDKPPIVISIDRPPSPRRKALLAFQSYRQPLQHAPKGISAFWYHHKFAY